MKTLFLISFILSSFFPKSYIYYSKIELALLDNGFNVIFTATKVYPGETPEKRPKIYSDDCGNKAFWTPKYEGNIVFQLSGDCKENADFGKVIYFIYGENVAKYVKNNQNNASTRHFEAVLVDIRPNFYDKRMISFKLIDMYENR